MTDVARVSEQESAFLEIAPGAPVLRVRHVCYAHGDEPISYSEAIYRTDGYARSLELERLRI
jgi:DNA-binding GntR family transcriptional regulator